MVNVSIDVTDLGGEARPGDKVVFWRPRMGGSATHAGRVISTAPVTVFLTDGKATVSDVEPGEMTVLLQCRGVESQGPVTVGVPDGDHTVTLRALLESQFEYAPPIVSAVQEAASNASASEEAAIEAQVRSEAAADRADAKVDDAINNGANLIRNEVKQDADRAVSARQAATQAETKAKASEGKAATSESNAKTSETNAKQSETNAGDYAAVATTAATEAVDAMEVASGAVASIGDSVSRASTSAENAALSETNAAQYESSAATHAQNATEAAEKVGTAAELDAWAQAAQEAADRVGTAEQVGVWASESSAAASRAAQSETNAKASEEAAATSESNAAASESAVSGTISRVDALEAMAGLAPESPVDGQTANLISQPDTLTRSAIAAEIDKRVRLFEAEPGSDVTTPLNDFLDGGGHVKIQEGTFWVDGATGINVPSDTILEFSPGTVLKVKPTSLTNYALLKLRDVQNVRIIDPVLVGERYEHTGTTGEWGMGIDMRGTTNVEIVNPHCSDFWGDGIYIGTTDTQQYCADTRIIKPICVGNRRQGISVISVKGLFIDTPTMKDTSGINPQAGIDIEPNFPTDHLEGIRITDMRSENNAGGGLALILGQLAGGGRIVDITVDGIQAIDNSPFRFAGTDGVLDGSISIRNVTSTRGYIQVRNYSTRYPHIYADNITIINPNESGSTSAKYGSGVAIIADTGDTNTGAAGNITISNLTVIDSRDVKKVMDAVYVWDGSGNSIPMRDVNIVNPKRLDFSNRPVTFYGAGRISDEYSALEASLSTFDRTVSHSAIAAKTYHNAPATTLRRITVAQNLPDGYPSFVVEVRAPHPIRIIPTGKIIHTMTTVAGRYIQSDEVGARIELENRDGALWVKNMVGTWTSEPDPIVPE